MTGTQTLRSIGTLLFILLGPIIWALQLTVIYGAQSSLCAFEVGEVGGGRNGLVVILIVGVSLMTLGVTTFAVFRPQPILRHLGGRPADDEVGSFLVQVMRVLAGLSALAMTYSLSAALLLPACAQLR